LKRISLFLQFLLSAYCGSLFMGVMPIGDHLQKTHARENAPPSSGDYVVYSVYQPLNLGNQSEQGGNPKDYYMNVGLEQGVRVGSVLEVRRKISSYDLMSEQLYKDLAVPIAWVKVIHVDSMASIARLEKLLPIDNYPAVTPRAVMVGDLVRMKQ